MADKLPEEVLKRIAAVKNKRARIVLDGIAERGSITTEEIKQRGYNHPPRAAQDVRDLGFPLITTLVKDSTGRPIAEYSLDVGASRIGGKSGRIALPKRQRDQILTAAGSKCQVCGATHDLQIDHRVPYQVAGETLKDEDNAYMALCGSCNRRKSWACEHCQNFLKLKDIGICKTCYWARPETHSHVAMEELRRIDLVWQGDELKFFNRFRMKVTAEGTSIADAIKKLLENLME